MSPSSHRTGSVTSDVSGEGSCALEAPLQLEDIYVVNDCQEVGTLFFDVVASHKLPTLL